MELIIRAATADDLDSLMAIEEEGFAGIDRLSRRAMRAWLRRSHRVFLVATRGPVVTGYILTIHHQGTRLGRIYSLAVAASHRGQGIAGRLLEAGEEEARERGCIDLRLEVARGNLGAIALYHGQGYRDFGIYRDYYENHDDALRMQKRIRHRLDQASRLPISWLQQQTPFSCGPATLMMALDYLHDDYRPCLREELAIWREATTIYMTSGHGGCHPLGLALAAQRRGVAAEVWISSRRPLFVEGVRQELKKRVITQVDADFRSAASTMGIPVHIAVLTAERIESAIGNGEVVMLLISTWRLDNRKAPHWVVVTGYDERCFYVHDPDPGADQLPVDCQHCPIARGEIESMARFGSRRLQTAVILSTSKDNP